MTVTRSRHLLAAGLAILLLLGAMGGCSKFDAGDPNPNIAPETTLSFSPAEGDTSNYRVRMNWFGWDPDGEIAYYWTRWDTFEWRRVVNTDSVFLVSASADTVDEAFGYEYHSFSVKAVDNDDAEDPTPETVEFTAFTIVPDTDIIRGPNGVTGPMVTFEWSGSDRDGVIVGYGYRLFKWEQSTSEWIQVTSQTGLDAETVVANFGPIEGLHRFEVWSIDDAGAADQTPAAREFTCNPELAGPKLFIISNVFGIRTYRGPVWNDVYNIPTPIFAGERLAFEWIATAESYGGQVVGYRHAYDDTSNWPSWSAFDNRFSVVPELGRHSLYVNALDNANVRTRARVYFDVVEATLDEYILVVDDWDSKEGTPNWPTDEDRNAFWNSLLAGYKHIRVEWQPDQNQIGGVDQPPDVDALRGASTVIWYSDQEYSVLNALFNPFSARYNALAGYMRVGGNLVLSGQECLKQILYENYPMTVEPADTTEAARFVRDYLHIGSADYSGYEANKVAPWNYGYCFYGDNPTADGEAFDLVDAYIDSVGPSGYPERGKWPFYVYSGQNGRYLRCGLPGIETVTAYQGTGLEIFEMDSFLNMNFEGVPSSVLYLSGDNHGNSWYIGHPVYYLKEDPARHNFDKILELFGEEKLR